MRLRRSSGVSQWPQLRIDIEEIRRNVRRNYASVRIANQIVLAVAAQLPHAIVRPGAAMVPGDNAVFEHGNLTGRGLDSAATETPRVVPYTGVVCDGYVIENRKTVLRDSSGARLGRFSDIATDRRVAKIHLPFVTDPTARLDALLAMVES